MLIAGLAIVIPGSVAAGAELPRPDEATDFLAPARLADSHPRWTVEHGREAALFAGALVWPSIGVGTVVDSNPFHQHGRHRAAVGVALAPQFLAERDDGLHRTDVYGSGDLRLFPDAPAADAVNGRVGVLHDWSPRPDLNVRLQGEADRRTDPFDNPVLLGASTERGLIYETDALAAGSVQKSFDRFFVSLSGTVLRATFQASTRVRAAAGSRGLSGETAETVKGRVGYLLPSSIYVFAEPGGDWRALDRESEGSSGTRAIAGIGIAHFGLLGGEVFAGRQAQAYPTPYRDQALPVVGGRLAWSPDRAWTIAAQLDESLGEVAVGTLADALGTPTRTRTGLGSLDWQPSPLWRARAQLGAAWVDYAGTPRSDRLLFGDLRVDYAVSRSCDLSGLLRASALDSTIAAATYDQVAATLAATYHY